MKKVCKKYSHVETKTTSLSPSKKRSIFFLKRIPYHNICTYTHASTFTIQKKPKNFFLLVLPFKNIYDYYANGLNTLLLPSSHFLYFHSPLRSQYTNILFKEKNYPGLSYYSGHQKSKNKQMNRKSELHFYTNSHISYLTHKWRRKNQERTKKCVNLKKLVPSFLFIFPHHFYFSISPTLPRPTFFAVWIPRWIWWI